MFWFFVFLNIIPIFSLRIILASAEFEDEFVYYKNQIDSLVKELDKEKQERQRQQEQFEQTIRSKDKHLDQCKEQMKKEKDSMIREFYFLFFLK
mgnify:CR=1 FL=1